MSIVIVVDVETTGLSPWIDHVWDIGLHRLVDGRLDCSWSSLVAHDRSLARGLPDRYRAQHDEACDGIELPALGDVRDRLAGLFTPDCDGKPTLVGACPWFDAGFLAKLLGREMWNHRLRCVESMTAGHLGRDVGGLSDCLDALGLDPIDEAHRAAQDADAALRIWQHLVTA